MLTQAGIWDHFIFPKISWKVLPVLLALDEAKGREDRAHARLTQYKQLERKVVDQVQSDLDNVEFLRQSNIRLRIEFDIEPHLDRIVELINRSNQLNYTKVRLETKASLAAFRDQASGEADAFLMHPAAGKGLTRSGAPRPEAVLAEPHLMIAQTEAFVSSQDPERYRPVRLQRPVNMEC